MTDREHVPPPCEHPAGHWMIPVTDPYDGVKTWRCIYCPAVRHFENRTIHPEESTP